MIINEDNRPDRPGRVVISARVRIPEDPKMLQFTTQFAWNTIDGAAPPPEVVAQQLDKQWEDLKRCILNGIYNGGGYDPM